MSTGMAVPVKVTLADYEPTVWRQLVLLDAMTLSDLHHAVQAAMGWDNSHLHLFEVKRGEQYSDGDADFDDETTVTLSELVARKVKRITYLYDFGDDWLHVVEIGKPEAADPERAYPACTDGAGACPPEDSGGAAGFADMLAVANDPTDPRQGEYRKWLGGDFDPAAFSLDDAELRLRAWFAEGGVRHGAVDDTDEEWDLEMTVPEVRSNLTELLERVEAGDRVAILRNGKLLAVVVPAAEFLDDDDEA